MTTRSDRPISIRRFNESDLDRVLRLVSQIDSPENLVMAARAQFTRELEESLCDEARFVADYAGVVIATMGCGPGPIPSKLALWADWLVVDQRFRRQNVAMLLYKNVENFAMTLGKKYLCLDIGNIDAQRAAYAFHLRNGFQIVGQIPDYWGELQHLNIMTKSLARKD